MINKLVSLFDKIMVKRAEKEFLRNVFYLGKMKPEILRSAHVRTINGSIRQDIVIADEFSFLGGTIISQIGGKITIKNRVRLGFGTLIGCAKSITIGEGVIFGDNVTVMDNNNHPVNPLDRDIVYRTPCHSEYRGWKYCISAPIVIGNNVFVGTNTRINKGVTIGDGAFIAANTVVVKDVPQNCLCAGNPGKIVKENLDQLPRLIPDSVLDVVDINK